MSSWLSQLRLPPRNGSTPAVRRWGSAALSLVFPPVCSHCEKSLDRPEIDPILCDQCVADIFTPKGVSCLRCGAYGVKLEVSRPACSECRDTKLWFDRVVSLGKYEGGLQKAIVQMKYQAGQPLAVAAGKQLAVQMGGTEDFGAVDLISCVPKYWLKRLLAGGNSVEVIMSGLVEPLGVPALPSLLECRRKITKQSMLSPDQRRRNVRGAWCVASGYDISGAHVVLVDDVMTTGATVNEAARALKKAGASRVSIAVVGRAERIG